MKHRSWIKVIAALSPRTAFRKTKSNPTASDAAASPAPPIPLSMLATLARVVQFLDKSYLEEEDLYSKPGVGLERQEVLRLCRCNQLPDLYSANELMMRRRKCIAEFLIRQAPSLPYDCATEMNIPAIPEEITASMVDTTDPASTKQLHFIQATWDAYKTSFAIEQLETDAAEQSQDTEDNPIDETIVVEDIEDDQYDDVPDQAKTTLKLLLLLK
ncbi:hypothetical protein PInf_001490 [Phytophthora infestans]|nr:hypothetical protein PInf_001490 [Phytophthora infestans]